MITDLINGELAEEVMRRIKRARLVAVPKPQQGVRPIAVGEVWLKLAEIVLLQRHEKKLVPLFAPYQFGVMVKSGCKHIIHKLNKRHENGGRVPKNSSSILWPAIPWRHFSCEIL